MNPDKKLLSSGETLQSKIPTSKRANEQTSKRNYFLIKLLSTFEIIVTWVFKFYHYNFFTFVKKHLPAPKRICGNPPATSAKKMGRGAARVLTAAEIDARSASFGTGQVPGESLPPPSVPVEIHLLPVQKKWAEAQLKSRQKHNRGLLRCGF